MSQQEGGDEDFEVPDDLSGLAGAAPMGEDVAPPTVAIFTPIQNGRVLAAVCALNELPGEVVETAAGAFAVLDDASAGATDRAGQVVSTFVKTQPILAMERRAGQITIHQWNAGVKGDSMPPGLALDQAPGVIVSLMTGTQDIKEVAATHPGKTYHSRMGKFAAFKELRKAAKEAKKAYKKQQGDAASPDSGDAES